eukprot:TRINITY_DN16139_c0_g1_i1.p1 TRINITY_DN16139_c0_g1~~TRINITY_DN16139_c0_g1_i1.p1  ORF type:complete len:106 (-),score=17.64 TRINITY_DN16139_c0_g1_i1:83-400(-)
MITGEAIPKTKTVGDNVVGSTINGFLGTLIIKATHMHDEGTLAGIRRLIEEAQASKPRLARASDKVARYFVPSIFFLSGLVFIVWMVLAYKGIVNTHNQGSFPFA